MYAVVKTVQSAVEGYKVISECEIGRFASLSEAVRELVAVRLGALESARVVEVEGWM